MHNPGDDNELDHLIREAADKYDIPLTANWQKMREQLNIALPAAGKKRSVFFLWWLLPVLLLSGAVYWRLTHKNDPATATDKYTQTGKRDNGVITPAETVRDETAIVSEKGATQKTLVDNLTQKKNKSITTVAPGSIRQQNTSLLKKQSPEETTEEKKEIVPLSSFTEKEENRQLTPSAETKNTATVNEKNTMPPLQQTVTNTDTGIPVTEKIIGSNTKNSNTTAFLPPQAKGWSFSLLAGFDKSTVKFRYGNDPGINIGILGGYHFNNRWSIHTGAVYTQKNYKLAGEDFTAPKGSWISYYNLVNVDGYCRMWEIPLVMRYAIHTATKNSFFLSAGLSSYFMTRENYNYFYYVAGQPVTKNASYASTDTDILSIAHISTGFESRISKNLSMQIEPYAKLPLSGVGFGNIKLSSFGINFALQKRMSARK